MAASPLTAPPITASPSPRSTGWLSPVSSAWLTVVRPSTTTPSVGIRSPGFTITLSPRVSVLTGTDHEGRIDVGRPDRHRDQRHHPGLFSLQFANEAREERPPAIEIDSGGEREYDVLVAREPQPLAQAEPVLDHRAQEHDRNGQRERDPEAARKQRHRVA